MYTCKYCGKDFENKGQLGGHVGHCELNPLLTTEYACPFCNIKIIGKKKFTFHVNHCSKNPDHKAYNYNRSIKVDVPVLCPFCLKECKNNAGMKNHSKVCRKNPNRDLTYYEKTGISHLSNKGWSKGLTKETDPRVNNMAKALKEGHADGSIETRKNFKLSTSQKEHLSNIAVENNYAEHFGHRKVYTYKDISFQSSYEVELAKNLDVNNVKWLKPKRLPYIDFNGKKHYYTADLYLPDYDIYLDPKNDFLIQSVNPHLGYKDSEKIQWVMEQNSVIILILNKDQLTWEALEPLILKCGVTP